MPFWERPEPRMARLPAIPLLLVLLGPLAGSVAPQAGAAPYRPPPPASRPTIYNPDASTCKPELITAGFQQQLKPFADQPPAVLARLKLVQGDMTRATLRRCVAQGRMTREEATALALKLGVISPP